MTLSKDLFLEGDRERKRKKYQVMIIPTLDVGKFLKYVENINISVIDDVCGYSTYLDNVGNTEIYIRSATSKDILLRHYNDYINL